MRWLWRRLREGVAPWRDANAVLAAVTEWVRGSLGGAEGDVQAVFVADDGDRIVGLVTVGSARTSPARSMRTSVSWPSTYASPRIDVPSAGAALV